MLKAPRTKTHDLLNALRNWHPDHRELVSFFAVLASAIKENETGLTEKCIALVMDYCDEASGEIESDLIKQQAMQAWDDRVVSVLADQFQDVQKQLDALTIRSNT